MAASRERAAFVTAGVAVGIDVAEERKGLDIVAIDRRRRIVASVGRATVGDVAAEVVRLVPDIVCIDSPSGWSTSGRSRAAERHLRHFGINAFSTGADPGPHPFYRWMRVGFSIFEALAGSFDLYKGGSAGGTAAEVFPEASAVLLTGHLRPANVPKSVFRRRVLDEHGLDAAALSNIDQVDAALGALTGAIALEGRSSAVGDPAEGVILLPVATLPSTPLLRPSTGDQLLRMHSTGDEEAKRGN